MFKYGSIEEELQVSMNKQLVANEVENKHGFTRIAKALDYLNAAASIFDQSGFQKEAEDISSILEELTSKDWKDQMSGGLADNKDPSDFDKDELEKGIKVEMEHTTDHATALEIAMDHLKEHPDYYKELEKMENKMEAKQAVLTYGHKLIVNAISVEDITGMLDNIEMFDVNEEDLKNIFASSPLVIIAKLVERLYALAVKTKDEGAKGAFEELKDQLTEYNLMDPEKREHLKEDLASKLATAVKTLKILKMFA